MKTTILIALSLLVSAFAVDFEHCKKCRSIICPICKLVMINTGDEYQCENGHGFARKDVGGKIKLFRVRVVYLCSQCDRELSDKDILSKEKREDYRFTFQYPGEVYWCEKCKKETQVCYAQKLQYAEWKEQSAQHKEEK